MGHDIEVARRSRDALAELTEQLINDYDGLLPPGAVIRCVARTVQEFRLAGLSTELLPYAVEPIVREGLAERALNQARR